MTRLQIAPGDGLVVKRRTALLFLPGTVERATPLIDAFRKASDGEALDAVTGAADDCDLAVDPFVVVEWHGGVRLAVFGPVDVTSDHRSLPRLSAGESATWVERTVRGGPIELRSGDAAVHPSSDVELGTVPAGGFALALSGTAGRPPPTIEMPVTEPAVETVAAVVAEPEVPEPIPEPPPRPAPSAAPVEAPIVPPPAPALITGWYDAAAGRDDPTLDVPEGFTDGYREPAAARDSWTLRFVDGGNEAVDETLLLGRRPTAEADDGPEPVRLVQLDCPQMSARHLAAWVDNGAVWVRDLHSRNGSWIVTSGDHRLVALEPGVPTPLDHGTHVQIGTEVFVVERTANPD